MKSYVLSLGFLLASIFCAPASECHAGEPGIAPAPGDCHWVTKYREVQKTVKQWYTVRGIVDYRIKKWKEPTGAFEYDCDGCLVPLYRIRCERVPVYGPIKRWKWVCKTVVVPVDRVLVCKTPACFGGDCEAKRGHHSPHAGPGDPSYYQESEPSEFSNGRQYESLPPGELQPQAHSASHRTASSSGWRSASPDSSHLSPIPRRTPVQAANVWAPLR